MAEYDCGPNDPCYKCGTGIYAPGREKEVPVTEKRLLEKILEEQQNTNDFLGDIVDKLTHVNRHLIKVTHAVEALLETPYPYQMENPTEDEAIADMGTPYVPVGWSEDTKRVAHSIKNEEDEYPEGIVLGANNG